MSTGNKPNHLKSQQKKSENDEISIKIQDLISFIKIQTNPFLFKDVKDFILKLNTENIKLQIPSYFHDSIKTRINTLIQSLFTLDVSILITYLNKIHSKILSLPEPENILWDAANLLIDTPSIKSLNANLSSRLIKTIVNIQQQAKLDGFIKDRYAQNDIKQENLEEQIKQKKLGTHTIKKISTLISQIIKLKPKQLPLYERILKNISNLNVFLGQCLFAQSENGEYFVNGKIKEVKISNDLLWFRIFGQGLECDVIFNLSGGYINSVRTITYFSKNLNEALKIKYSKNSQEGQILLSKVNITPNIKNVSQMTSILSNGTYDVIRGNKFLFSSGNYLIFKNITNGTQYTFQHTEDLIKLSQINNQNKKLKKKHKKINFPYSFDTLMKSYVVNGQYEQNLEYKQKNTSDNCIQIKKSLSGEGSDVLDKLKEIDKKKTFLVNKMHGDYNNIFNLQLQKIMKNNTILLRQDLQKENLKQEDLDAFQSQLNMIIQLYKEIGITQITQNIVKQIVAEVNYTALVFKRQSLNTVRIMNLLSESKRYSDSMKNKQLLSFYGSTGSGKSTSVNFYMGIPLQRYVNNFGDQVVKINEKQCKKENIYSGSKIGQNIGTSETLYSQGYNFIQGKFDDSQLQQLSKKYMLCDNPGFLDTRGSQYEICTNLSIDQAISNCQGIKAIILTIPYQALVLDRARHLVELIFLMQQRFPQILKKQTDSNKCFNIIVTKCNSDKQKNGFKDRLTKHLDQYYELIKNTSNETQSLDTNYYNQMVDLFKALIDLLNKKRIHFVDIEDQIQREQVISKFISGQTTVDKSKYIKAMEGSDMQKSFSNQISASVHTWVSLILQPYFNEFPKDIKKQNQLIDSKNKQIVEIENEMIELKNCIDDNKSKIQNQINTVIPNAKSQYQRVMKRQFTDLQTQIIENSNITFIEQQIKNIPQLDSSSQKQIEKSNSTINKCKGIIQVKMNQLQEIDRIIIKEEKLIQKYIQQKNNLYDTIEECKTGQTEKIIYQLSYMKNKTIQVGTGSCTFQQRMQAMNKGQSLKSQGIAYTFIVGTKKVDTCSVVPIQTKFILLPNKEFDPNNYLKKCNTYYSKRGTYKTKIQSRNVNLEGAKLDETGKKITLSIIKKFSDDQKQSSYPFLKITHTIPNTEINWDTIVNSESERDKKIKDIQLYKKSIASKKIEKQNIDLNIKSLENDISLQKQKIKTVQQKNKSRVEKEIEKLKSGNTQQKIQLLQEQKQNIIKIQQQKITSYQNDNTVKQQNIKNYEQNQKRIVNQKQQQQLKLKQLTFTYKRYAYLIKQQLEKKVPQSLDSFIDIAYKFSQDVIAKEKNDGTFAKNAKQKQINFDNFKNIYGKHRMTLENIVTEHLRKQTN